MLKLIYNRIIDYCYYLYNINSLSDEIYTSGLGGDTASLNIKDYIRVWLYLLIFVLTF